MTIIVARRFGRMANRLVVFANLIALAEDRDCRIINPTFHSYSSHFANLCRNFYCAYPMPTRVSVFDRISLAGDAVRNMRGLHHMTRAAVALAKRGIIPGAKVADELSAKDLLAQPELTHSASLLGDATSVFFRDWRFRVPDLVMRHAPTVRSFLRPVQSVERRSAAAVQSLRDKADLVVGVHIRHGDYETFKGGAYFFPTERYAAWMRNMAVALAPRHVAFLICSDGKPAMEAFGDLEVRFGPGDPIGDLFALAACDLLIGPVSTFTQWASYYGNAPLYHLRHTDDDPRPDRFAVSDLSDIP
jgi:hypothetical protein